MSLEQDRDFKVPTDEQKLLPKRGKWIFEIVMDGLKANKPKRQATPDSTFSPKYDVSELLGTSKDKK